MEGIASRLDLNRGRRFASILGLLVATAISATIVASTALPAARVPAGIFLVLVAPGLSVVAALYPTSTSRISRRIRVPHEMRELGWLDRLSFGAGLSIAISPLVGLALNYSAVGFSTNTFATAITGLVAFASAVALARSTPLLPYSRIRASRRGRAYTKNDFLLAGILIASIIGVSLAIYSVLSQPSAPGGTTQFYVVEVGGNEVGSAVLLFVNENTTIQVGIVNHEDQPMTYHVEGGFLLTDGTKPGGWPAIEVGQLDIDPGEGKEIVLNLSAPEKPGDYRLEVQLYLGNAPSPYRTVHVQVRVSSG